MREQQVRLHLTRPANTALFFSLPLLIILAAFGEALARSSLVQDHIPYQAYGTNHTQMEIQLANLGAFIRDHGAPDCFVFGSSQAFRDVDADEFAAALAAAGDGHYTCYNFGVTGSQVATTALLNKILIQQYRPRLVVIGTSFLDYTKGRDLQIDERFVKNDWLAYQTGDFSINGWLTEYSYAWRALTILSYSAQYKMNYAEVLREAHKWDGEIAPSGFALSQVHINPLIPMEAGFASNLRLEFGDFSVSERNLAALEQIIAESQSVGAKVIVAEMPYHPALLDLKDDHGNPRADRQAILGFQDTVNLRIQQIADDHTITYIRVNSSLSIPEDVWFDLYHLNRPGAALFSQWLAAQAAALLTLNQ
ncbi:MAG: hypothetical protein HFACDABA_01247 [Anaerolineales bacterium]|nr:hypothetical protein [Anaerolineales bacterium]